MPQLVRAKHVRDAGLMSYHELKNFEPARAEQLRDLISQSPGATCLSSVGAFEGVVDSGASKFATSDPMDFVEGTYEKDKAGTMMKGIAGGLQIVGRGTVRYEVMDHNGVIQIITGEGLHVEGLPCRLIPPQKAMPTDDDGDFRINGQRAYFMFANTKGRASTPFDPSTGLPTIALMHDVNTAAKRLDRAMYSCVTEENNQNLTPSQKEALRWHFRLGHPGMQVVNWLARRGLLGPFSSKIATIKECPKCGTCQCGKQTRRPTGTTRTEAREDKIGGITHEKLAPGDEIACDQFEVKRRGRLFKSYGKERETEQFTGGTIFVDVATGFTRVYFQVSLGAEETTQAKLSCEREAMTNGVAVKASRTDNGVFSKQEFMKEIAEKGQRITLSGVGAHHQNGVAERAIRTVVTKARTMLLHAMLRWSEQTTTNLWPMAMNHAAFLVNAIPQTMDGLSPEEKFAKAFKPTNRLLNAPVWGCPVYVLEPTLQDGKKLPKWRPRSRRAQFVGWSTLHASNVPLVRNLRTGAISPQFHVAFDNWFETVAMDEGTEDPFEWDVILTHGRFEVDVERDELDGFELDEEWLTRDEMIERRRVREERLHRAQSQEESFKKKKTEQKKKAKTKTSTAQPEQGNESQSTTPKGDASPTQEQAPASEPPAAKTEPNKSNDGSTPRSVPSPPTAVPASRQKSSKVMDVEVPTIQWPKRKPVSPQKPATPMKTVGTSAKKSPAAAAPVGVSPKKTPVRWSGRQRVPRKQFTHTDKGVASYLNFVQAVTKIGDKGSMQAQVAHWTMLSMNPANGLLENFVPALTPMALKAVKGRDPDLPTH